jgi:acetyl esterase/lipase
MQEQSIRAARALTGSIAILDFPPPPGAVRLAYGDDACQFGELRLPDGDGPHPVVMAIHGGFWRSKYDLEHIGHLCAALTAAGFATWSVEYRRLGNPGGGWPGTLIDMIRALDHLSRLAEPYSLDLSRIVVIGHSAGGHLALWLGGAGKSSVEPSLTGSSQLQISGVVSLGGVCDLRRAWELSLSNHVVEEFLGGSPQTIPDRYVAASPVEMAPLDIPQVLVHGVEDDVVPFEISQRYFEIASRRGDDVSLVALPGVGHFEPIDPYSDAWPHVLRAIHSISERRIGV